MVDQGQFLNSRGAMVIDEGGNKIGSVEDIYLDTDTNQPEWFAVKAGLVGGVSFVPLANASLEGNDIRVPYDKDRIKGSPSIKADRELSREEEAELYRYYGLSFSDSGTDTYEGRGTTTDDAMTRSEEELRVGKTQQERGRARLRKYVVTENVQQTVPIQREEVRVEREPITDANFDAATSGPELKEDEHEVVLTEERPVIEKQTVPKERVRLSKETVSDEQQVSEELRKEQIEQEGDLRS